MFLVRGSSEKVTAPIKPNESTRMTVQLVNSLSIRRIAWPFQVSSRYFVHVGHLPGEKTRVHHVAIRGTVSLSDLSIDLKTRQVFDEECGCLFHAGFKEVCAAIALKK